MLAKQIQNWDETKISFQALVKEMVDVDLKLAKRDEW